MLEAGTHPINLSISQRTHLKWNERERALFRIKAALAKLVLPATDHVERISQKERVERSTADVNNIALL